MNGCSVGNHIVSTKLLEYNQDNELANRSNHFIWTKINSDWNGAENTDSESNDTHEYVTKTKRCNERLHIAE